MESTKMTHSSNSTFLEKKKFFVVGAASPGKDFDNVPNMVGEHMLYGFWSILACRHFSSILYILRFACMDCHLQFRPHLFDRV